jgi:hydrophobe/amphiphile efflux-3 (HAE3) family protein
VTDLFERFIETVTPHSKKAIVGMLILTLILGAGMPMVDQSSDLEQFETGSDAADAAAYIDQNFVSGDRDNQTTIQVIQRAQEGENVLSKDSVVRSLEFQQEIRETESINSTLPSQEGVFGVGNALALAAISQQSGGQAAVEQGPSLEQQIQALEQLSDQQYEMLVSQVLGEGGDPLALSTMPTSYEPGSTTATAHNTYITQETRGGTVEGPSGFSEPITSAQLELRDLAQQQEDQYTVFGAAIITDEIDQSFADSLAIVGPIALLFVVVVLTIAYRDIIDILLGVVGIVVVLVWTFGFMGWADIAFNQLLISVPVLLIGLSIDYAIHVFMRHREQQNAEESRDTRHAMGIALAGVGVALIWVTATAAIGFLSNLISPIGPLQDFGLVSSFGIIAALFVFGILIPALKVEIDEKLQSVGFDRQKTAFGTGESRVGSVLSVGATAAKRAPVVVLVLALLLSAGGAYGASQLDTTFKQEDFLADSPPEWTESLPGSMQPGTYQAKNDLKFIQANFQQEGQEADLLIRDDVTNNETISWLIETREQISGTPSAYKLPTGEAAIQSPLTEMRQTAKENLTFAGVLANNDENGDQIPDKNIDRVFEALLAANPSASEYVYQNEQGDIEALRIQVSVRGDSIPQEIAGDMRGVATNLEETSGGSLDVAATGDQVINADVEDALFETVLESLIITLIAVFIFLAGAYRLSGDTATLGIVTLLPVLFSVTWILGTMWLIEMPFNALTGTIAALTIGLGIAYSIHISSRYTLELERQGDIWGAMYTTVKGTGGALLGSAATTVGGFGTLSLAILPVLRQFGIITGLTIIYAFLASVLVLPSLLVLWTRYFAPAELLSESGDESTPPGSEVDAPAPDSGAEE